MEAAGIEPASASDLPLGLHAYLIYFFNNTGTNEQVLNIAVPKNLTAHLWADNLRSCMHLTSDISYKDPMVQAPSSQRALKLTKQLVRSVYRWQLIFCQ